MSEFETVLDLFMHEGFQGGLAAGLVVLGVFAVIWLATKSHVLGWAVAFAAAVGVVLSLQFPVDGLVLASLGAVALAGILVDVAHSLQPGALSYGSRAIAWGLTALSVFWFTSLANTADEAWISVAFPLVVLTMGAAIWSYRFGRHADLLGPIVAVTIIGVWVTVPETDMFTIVVGACLPLGLATLPPIRARAIGFGSLALAALIAWLTIAGGETRPLAIIGGWAAFGVLPVVPLLRVLGLRVQRRLVVLVVHVVYAILATRVVDIWDSIPVSLAIIGGLVFASGAALVVFGRGKSQETQLEGAEAQIT